MKNVCDYKTQNGLLKAIHKVGDGVSNVSVCWWLQNAKWCLIEKWGWPEKEASKYIAGYMPRISQYTAIS